MRFQDRQQAGGLLAGRLKQYLSPREEAVVIALPRGGVPVGYAISRSLGLPLDVIVVRKIGAPGNPEYGIGAIAEDGELWADSAALRELGIGKRDLDAAIEREMREVRRRVKVYRSGRAPLSVEGKTVILVDDGLATGVSATVAAQMLRRAGAGRILLAAPVCASSTAESILEHVDEVVCLHAPQRFFAVSLWYDDFAQLTDDDVLTYLREVGESTEIEIPADRGPRLGGTLAVPPKARGLVIFAHGSGSSRRSPRNLLVASQLNRAGFATLLFDLLTPEEASDRARIFDIPLLASRLVSAARWAVARPELNALPIGFFGASTGGGAAIAAAADLGERRVMAVVSRGGRPDLAGEKLERCRAPTLLLVGGEDSGVIELNEQVIARMPHADLVLIPGATHLFEEPGALEAVAREAASWFGRFFDMSEERKAG